MSVKNTANSIGYRLVHVVAVNKHGVKSSYRAFGRSSAPLQKLRHCLKNARRVPTLCRRLAYGEPNLALSAGKARHVVEHQHHVFSLVTEILGNRSSDIRAAQPAQRGDAQITPLNVSTSAPEALQGLDMSSALAERRTGVSARTQTLQADTLQNTATGASIMEEAVNQRLEMIARVYAETFFKPLGRYLLHLLHRYQDKQIQLRVKGRFMEFDPRKWDPDMDVSVSVGLGTGDRSKLIGTYRSILDLQQAFLTQLGANSPVRLTNVVYTCHRLCEAAGLESPERFFGTEEDAMRAEQALMQGGQEPSPEE